jgi:hypothetical protein
MISISNSVDRSQKAILKHGTGSGTSHPEKGELEDASDKARIPYLSNLLLAHPCFHNAGSVHTEESNAENTSDGRKSAFYYAHVSQKPTEHTF